MKLELLSCLPGMYNNRVAYAVISADVNGLDNYSPESVANWNDRVLPLIEKNFSSKLCQLGRFGFEDQGAPISLEIHLHQSGKNSADTVAKQLQTCIEKINQQMDYKAKLRFRPPGFSAKHDNDHEPSKSVQFK